MSGEIVVYQWNVVCYDSVTLKNVSQFVWSPDTPKECPCNILTHTFVESLIISTVSTKDIFVKNDISPTPSNVFSIVFLSEWIAAIMAGFLYNIIPM